MPKWAKVVTWQVKPGRYFGTWWPCQLRLSHRQGGPRLWLRFFIWQVLHGTELRSCEHGAAGKAIVSGGLAADAEWRDARRR